MIEGRRVLAVVPARGGSKRLPGKNIKLLAGKPLISWTIDAALMSSYIDMIVISSDSDDILDVAARHDYVHLHKRSELLASDTAKTVDVVLDVISSLAESGQLFDDVVVLQPTSPLRSHTHIDESLEKKIREKCDGVVSVCEVEHSPLWANTLPENLCMKGFIRDDVIGKRSQELPVYYRINGAIYAFSVIKLAGGREIFFNDKVFAYVMSRDSSVDIDVVFDFKLAETLIAFR